MRSRRRILEPWINDAHRIRSRTSAWKGGQGTSATTSPMSADWFSDGGPMRARGRRVETPIARHANMGSRSRAFRMPLADAGRYFHFA